MEGLYEQLALHGYGYGPAFRGLRAVWRDGADVFAEVRLPEEARDEADRYGMHPALLDAVLHAVGPGGLLSGGQALVPFAWSGVHLHMAGECWSGPGCGGPPDTLQLTAVDAVGDPVITVDSLVLRPVTAVQLDGGHDRDGLFTVRWTPAQAGTALADSEPVGPVRWPGRAAASWRAP